MFRLTQKTWYRKSKSLVTISRQLLNASKKLLFHLLTLHGNLPIPNQHVPTDFFKWVMYLKFILRKSYAHLNDIKATDIDNLPPGLLKDSAKYISTPLFYIINLSLKSSTIPTLWKSAKILPIYKSGKSTDPGNHRPISILPVVSKILEKSVQKI